MKIEPGRPVPRTLRDLGRQADIVVRMTFATEKQWMAHVKQTLAESGWIVYHTFNSVHSDFGFPDIEAIHLITKRRINVELKGETDRANVSHHQATWLRLIAESGGEAYVWFPSDAAEFYDLIEGETKYANDLRNRSASLVDHRPLSDSILVDGG